jgi:hypothetical protein
MNLELSARIAACLTVFALVMSTLWPASASAKPPGIPQGICSADTSKYSNNGYGPAKLPPSEHRLKHCALCLLSAHGALATTPNFPWLTRLTTASAGGSAAEPESPQRVFLHPHAQPRAPPPSYT